MSARGVRSPGWREVKPTELELAAWAAKHPNRPGRPGYRVQCKGCDARIWLSGIAVGSHRRRCRDTGEALHYFAADGALRLMRHELDRVTRNQTAFASFDALLDCDPRYTPTLAVRFSECRRLADAYDAVMADRGDERRAFRAGVAA